MAAVKSDNLQVVAFLLGLRNMSLWARTDVGHSVGLSFLSWRKGENTWQLALVAQLLIQCDHNVAVREHLKSETVSEMHLVPTNVPKLLGAIVLLYSLAK